MADSPEPPRSGPPARPRGFDPTPLFWSFLFLAPLPMVSLLFAENPFQGKLLICLAIAFLSVPTLLWCTGLVRFRGEEKE